MKKIALALAVVAISSVSQAAVTGLKALNCYAFNMTGVAQLKLNEQGLIESLANGIVKNTYEPIALGTNQTQLGSLTSAYSYLVIHDVPEYQLVIYFGKTLVDGKQNILGQLANVAKKTVAEGETPRTTPFDYIPVANLSCSVEMSLQ